MHCFWLIPILPIKLPYNEYYEYFGPDYNLHINPSNMENQNSAKDLERIRIPAVPSVPFQTTPNTTEVPEEDEEDKDERPKPRIWNGKAYDSDPEDDDNSNQRARDNVDTSAAANDVKKEA
ncbi:hypothetical protein Drorol1_Dr00021308 [Drosera rotundifolia]